MSLFISSYVVRPAHAAGQLLIAPATQPIGAIGSTFTVQVNVSSIDTFDTWDITVRTNSSVILPSAISTSGNVLGSVDEIANCVNGVGTGCGLGIRGDAHSAASSSSGYPFTGSGLLFTITYRVVGAGYSYITVLITDNLIVFSGKLVPHTTSDGVYGTPPSNIPVANFGFSPVSPTQGDNVTFDATSSTDPNAGATIVKYDWTVSPVTGGVDGFENVTATPTMVHQFTRATGWAVTLIVTDNLGHVSKQKTLVLTVSEKTVRRLAVTDMAASPQDNILAGTRVAITVRVINQGTQPATGFNVTVLLEGRVVKTFNSTDTILRGFADYKSFQLDTTGWKADTYLLAGATNSSDPSTWAFVSIRIILPYQGASLPFTIPEFVGVIIVLLVAIGIVRLFLGGVQTKRRHREEALP